MMTGRIGAKPAFPRDDPLQANVYGMRKRTVAAQALRGQSLRIQQQHSHHSPKMRGYGS